MRGGATLDKRGGLKKPPRVCWCFTATIVGGTFWGRHACAGKYLAEKGVYGETNRGDKKIRGGAKIPGVKEERGHIKGERQQGKKKGGRDDQSGREGATYKR